MPQMEQSRDGVLGSTFWSVFLWQNGPSVGLAHPRQGSCLLSRAVWVLSPKAAPCQHCQAVCWLCQALPHGTGLQHLAARQDRCAALLLLLPALLLTPGDTLSPGVNQCCCWVAREGAANVRFKGMGLLVASGGLCHERKGPREAKPHLYTPGEQLHE